MHTRGEEVVDEEVVSEFRKSVIANILNHLIYLIRIMCFVWAGDEICALPKVPNIDILETPSRIDYMGIE